MKERRRVKCFRYAVALNDTDREAVIQAELDLLVNAKSLVIGYLETRIGGQIRVTITYIEQIN